MYLGLRILAAILWTLALGLLILSSVHHDHQLAASNWALFVSLIATSITHYILSERAMVKESQRTARLVTNAVAEALRSSVIISEAGVSRRLDDSSH